MHICKITVMGDSGKPYDITITGPKIGCTCLAFRYGGGAPCKHMKHAAKVLFDTAAV